MADKPLSATDAFFAEQGGFGYDIGKVVAWLKKHAPLPERGRVLDLCCGDGIWSEGMQRLRPRLELWGVDISRGGIEQAHKRLPGARERFVVADAEEPLPVPKDYFDLVFARGLMIFNQHDMTRPGTVALLEAWHEHLAPGGRFFSTYLSKTELAGTYTPTDEVRLPLNTEPKLTRAVDFRGGKFHHSKESFLAPFRLARNVEIESYEFVVNRHNLVTRRKPPA
jgi:SAM-dependent methyltransferase